MCTRVLYSYTVRRFAPSHVVCAGVLVVAAVVFHPGAGAASTAQWTAPRRDGSLQAGAEIAANDRGGEMPVSHAVDRGVVDDSFQDFAELNLARLLQTRVAEPGGTSAPDLGGNGKGASER